MRPVTSTALAALILGFALCTQAGAQNQVHVFEEAPSIDELRAILIPDSGPGQSRKIEIPRRDMMAAPTPVVPSAAVTPAVAPQPAQAGKIDNTETVKTAEAPAKDRAVKPASIPAATRPDAGAVAFRINFATASDTVPSSYRPHLDRIVDLLQQEPSLALTIEGHTDAYGSVEYNLELSRRRAIAVMRYLVGHGVDESRLVAVGKGKTSPLTDNPFDGRNRRVQFVSAGQAGT